MSRFLSRPAHVFTLTFLIAVSQVSSETDLSSDLGCATSFRNTSNEFDVCKTKLCFLIQPEKPFVIADPKAKLAPSQPFPCRNNANYSGVFFEIMKRVGRSIPEVDDAMCIYGGPKCSFDDSVHFVADKVRHNPSYRFVAGGFLYFMPDRSTPYTVHSQPWYSETMVIFSRHHQAKQTSQAAWEQVFQPYSEDAWNLLAGLLSILCIGLVIHTCRFSKARSFRELIRWLALSRSSQRGVWETASWTALRLAVAVFFTVAILLYEVSYLILTKPENISNIEELKSLGLRNYAIIEGDASETIFRYAVGWENNTSKAPWVQVNTLDEAINAVRNNSVKYAFSFKTSIQSKLRADDLCDKIFAIPTVKMDSGGWYYGLSIPLELRQKIDKALATLVLEDLPRKSMMGFGLAPLNCGKWSSGLNWKVLLFVLLLTVGPLLLKHIVSLIFSYIWPDIEKSNNKIRNLETDLDSDSDLDPDPDPDDYSD